MAIKAYDGFDHYNQKTDFLARSNWLQWQVVSTISPTIAFVSGLTPYGKAVSLTTSTSYDITSHVSGYAALRGVFADRNAEGFVGLRMKLPVASGGFSSVGMWLEFRDTVAGSPQFAVHFDETNYSVSIWKGSRFTGTLISISSNNVWPGTSAFFAEIGCKVDSSTGYVTVKVNGVTVLNSTGINSQSTANAWFDAVDMQTSPCPGTGGSTSSFTSYFDDFYYTDTTSGPGLTPANTFLGDVRVSTLFATGDDAVQFTPLANLNWQEISEQAMDSDTSYNSDATAGNQDTFTFGPASSAITTVLAVQITYAARKDDAGSRTMGGVIKIAGVSYVFGTPDTVGASTTYIYYSDMWILNPATSLNFTLSDINAADYGYKLVT